MISVVIPLYNKEQSIASTLQTVLNQTYQDFEIVIVDDGSTDHSVEEVTKVLDPRIRLIHQKNAGVSAARNRGIEEAKGEYIAFLDADDEWKPEYLNTQYELTQKYPECSVFACNYEFKDTQGKVTPTIIRKLPFKGEDGILSNYFEVASYSHPPICSISIMVKKNAIQSIGGFPVGIKSGEDLLTWARLAVKEKIAYNRKPYAIYNTGFSFKRIPSEFDIVGKELRLLHKTYHIQYLNNYISRWHKNRAYMFMYFGRKLHCFKNAYISLKYNIKNHKVIIYVILSLLPKYFRYKIINSIK